MKITPGHDPNDYEIGRRHNLPIVSVMNEDATMSAEAGPYAGMTREELALHAELRAVWPVHPRVQLAVVGGPSLFRVSQRIVSDFTYTQSYPYDEAQFATSETLTATKTRIGFNIGGDAAFFFTRQIGIGAKVMLSRATLHLPIDEDREAEVEAGGLITGVGLRLRF